MEAESPDYHIEQFWMQFKTSMSNFYSSHKRDQQCMATRDLERWSRGLNQLQHNKKYSQIERQIRDYMICYGIDVMRCGSGYHIGILGTNIKRWNKVSSNYKLGDATHTNTNATIHMRCFSDCVYYDLSRALFQCCLDICIALNKDGLDIGNAMQDVELIVIQRNILPLLDMAATTRKSCIYDILIRHVKWLLIDEIKNEYGEDIFKGIGLETLRGKTLAKLLLPK